jgi:hypothetical protein
MNPEETPTPQASRGAFAAVGCAVGIVIGAFASLVAVPLVAAVVRYWAR